MAIKDNIIQEVLFQKLAPLAITKYWNLIQQCLLDALSGQKASGGHASRLMAAVQAGRIQVWCATSKDEKPVLAGMVFTQVGADPLLGYSMLYVYGLTIRAPASREVYAHCMDELAKFGKANGCHAIEARTTVRGIQRILVDTGFNTGPPVMTKEI